MIDGGDAVAALRDEAVRDVRVAGGGGGGRAAAVGAGRAGEQGAGGGGVGGEGRLEGAGGLSRSAWLTQEPRR